MLDSFSIEKTLTDRFGIALNCKTKHEDDGFHICIVPLDIPETQGFVIEALIGWRTIQVRFRLGNYAAGLLTSMHSATLQQRTIFNSVADSIQHDSSTIQCTINSNVVDLHDEKIWLYDWRSLTFELTSPHMSIDHKNEALIERLAVMWCGKMLGLTLALLPVEQEEQGEAEGGSSRIEINRYERSRINRAACIEIHGIKCKVCDFNFEDFYGEDGHGFIEVHHIEPVSGMVLGTIVDPSRDLVPLCANCHAMIHKRRPPYSLEELRSKIKK